MPCDPDDESNVLVPSPISESERINEILENERLDRPKIAANRFGSAFKVLPEAREKAMAETIGQTSGTSGTDTKVYLVPGVDVVPFGRTCLKHKF